MFECGAGGDSSGGAAGAVYINATDRDSDPIRNGTDDNGRHFGGRASGIGAPSQTLPEVRN